MNVFLQIKGRFQSLPLCPCALFSVSFPLISPWNIPITHALVELMVFYISLKFPCFPFALFCRLHVPYWTGFSSLILSSSQNLLLRHITNFSFHLLYFLNINFLIWPLFLKNKKSNIFSDTENWCNVVSYLTLYFCMSHLVLWNIFKVAGLK